MNAKLINTLCIFAVGILLTGCTSTLVNLTPERVPQNPSNIYTLSVATKLEDGSVKDNSIKAWIVIDGEKHEMKRREGSPRTFDYDFEMPPTRNQATYYYEAVYSTPSKNGGNEKELYSENPYTFTLTNRYVITMESERGPVGSVIPVLGRGFSRFDKIVIGGEHAETIYDSPVALRFVVPPLPANESYDVSLTTGSGDIPIGPFKVDGSEISITPKSFALKSGDKSIILFKVKKAAPAGGLLINVKTNVPDSVVMPEVLIPEGKNTVNVTLKGGTPGKGFILVSAPGFDSVKLPIEVKESDKAEVEVLPVYEEIEKPEIVSVEELQTNDSDNSGPDPIETDNEALNASDFEDLIIEE